MSDEVLFQKRMAKKVGKKAKASAIDTRSEAEKEIDTEVSETKLQTQEKLRKKRKMMKIVGGIGAAILGYFIYLGFQPYQGGMGYGVCKVFAEGRLRYPDTIKFIYVEEFAASIRVWYSHIDGFGQFQFDNIQCFFKQDPTGKLPFVLERIAINRRDVDADQLAQFNTILPVIFAHPPSLEYPPWVPDSLAGIKFETDAYRKQLGIQK